MRWGVLLSIGDCEIGAIRGAVAVVASAWVKGCAGVRIRWAVVETSLGVMLVAATDKGVCRLSFAETRDDLAARFPNADLVEGGAAFASLLEQVIAAVEQPAIAQSSNIPLDMQGTAFQQSVWAQLRAIPPGETRSYGELAASLGKPKASRAVGGANGANPVAVIVPCHRVVTADGGLGGYAYGAGIKAELLKREGCTV